jgi:hypothetical protein
MPKNKVNPYKGKRGERRIHLSLKEAKKDMVVLLANRE